VVRGRAVDPVLGSVRTAQPVPAAQHYGDLDAERLDLADLLRQVARVRGRDAELPISQEGLARELQEDTVVLRARCHEAFPSSTSAPMRPPLWMYASTTPSLASRSPRLAADASPFSLRIVLARSKSPCACSRAFLLSMTPAPVSDRRRWTSLAVAMATSPPWSRSRPPRERRALRRWRVRSPRPPRPAPPRTRRSDT